MNIDKTNSDDTILEELGKRIGQYRLNRNLTQNALATEAGVSERTVQRAEHGRTVQTTNLIRILRALNLVENLEALIPQQPISPIQQFKRKGKRRKRASSASAKDQEKPEWSWGDEE